MRYLVARYLPDGSEWELIAVPDDSDEFERDGVLWRVVWEPGGPRIERSGAGDGDL